MTVALLPHNEKPYADLCENLKTNKRVAFISATGTGKSYVVAKYVQEHGLEENTVVFSPTTAIRDAWNKMLPLAEVGMYQTLDKVHLDGVKCVILDEMHHLGSEVWGNNYKKFFNTFDGFVIGTTATEVRYLDYGRDMAKELFGNNRVDGWDLPKAVNDGVLPTLEYRKGRYSYPARLTQKRNEQTEDLFRKLDLAMSEASVDKMMREYKGIKTVVFCPTINSIKEFRAVIARTFPNAEQLVYHSKIKPKECTKILEYFNNVTEQTFIFTVDKLNEGVHIKGVDGIIMFRRTQSPIVFKQQLGRTLSVGGKEKVQVWDFVSNYSSITSILNHEEKDILEKFNEGITLDDRQILIDDRNIAVEEFIQRIEDACQSSWEEWEDEILKTNYANKSVNELQNLLPNRTLGAIKARVRILNLKKAVLWSEEETEYLMKNYNVIKVKDIAIHLKRPRTSISEKAKQLGIINSLRITEETKKKILEMYNSGINVTTIKRKLKTSSETVWRILNEANIFPPKKQNYLKLSDSIVNEAVNLHNKGFTCAEISKKLNIPQYRANEALNKKGIYHKVDWSDEELNFLKENYLTMTSKELGEKLGREKGQIVGKLQSMNLRRNKTKPYTEEEINYIKENYSTLGYVKIANILKRPQGSIIQKATKLGLKFKSPCSWTKEDVDFLINNRKNMTLEEISKVLNKSRSCVSSKALKLGLKKYGKE